MSDPTFLQFAARCQIAKFDHDGSSGFITDAEAEAGFPSDDARDDLFIGRFNAFCEQAERHARLLQAVWEWSEPTAYERYPEHTTDADFMRASRYLKAHVRALLAQTEEK